MRLPLDLFRPGLLRCWRRCLPLAAAAAIIAALVFVSAPGQVTHADTGIPAVVSDRGAASQAGSAQSETTVLIPRLQIQLTVPSDLSDLTWTVSGQQEARFSARKLEALGAYCNSTYGPLGLVRIGGPDDQLGMLGILIATFAHSYLYYITPQAVCSDAATALHTQLLPDLRAALATAVQIGPSPEITSDIVLVVNDTYRSGDIASISIRNDGQIPYKYNPRQEACEFTFERGDLQFEIPPATLCDQPGDDAEIAPGETVAVVQWSLDECTAPGFGCYAVRPLPTNVVRISGALDSANGLQRAQFVKTVFITGPTFTSDVELLIGTEPHQDPLPAGNTISLGLHNVGQIDYQFPTSPSCYLQFLNPEGRLFSIPLLAVCDRIASDTISPGEVVTVVQNWNRDECTAFGPSSCLTAQPLPPGDYVIKGSLWSGDKQSYAEFSQTLTISAPSPAPSQTVSPTPKVLPVAGGQPAGGSAPWALIAGGLAFTISTVCMAFAARKDEDRHGR